MSKGVQMRNLLIAGVFLLAFIGCVTEPELENQLGSITVSSEPDSAEVVLDFDNTDQVTPCTLNAVPIGWHVIEVRGLATYIGQRDSVEVRQNETVHVNVVLEKDVKRLFVATTPPGALITLDDESTGQFSPDTIEVSHWSYLPHVRLTLAGHYPIDVRYSLGPNRFGSIDTTFAPVADSRGILYTVQDTLFQAGFDGLSPRVITVLPSRIWQLLWSPDQKILACQSQNEISLLDRSGTTIATLPTGTITWSSSSRFLFLSRGDHLIQENIFRFDVLTGAFTHVHSATGWTYYTWANNVAVSPNDSLVIFLHHGAYFEAHWKLMGIDGSNVTIAGSGLSEHPTKYEGPIWLEPERIVFTNSDIGFISLNPFTNEADTLARFTDARPPYLTPDRKRFAVLTGTTSLTVAFGTTDTWTTGPSFPIRSSEGLILPALDDRGLVYTDHYDTWLTRLDGQSFRIIHGEPTYRLTVAATFNYLEQ